MFKKIISHQMAVVSQNRHNCLKRKKSGFCFLALHAFVSCRFKTLKENGDVL